MPKTNKNTCKYGKNCYRKNAEHLKNYSHDESVDSLSNSENEEKVIAKEENLTYSVDSTDKEPVKRKAEYDIDNDGNKKIKIIESTNVENIEIAEKIDLNQVKGFFNKKNKNFKKCNLIKFNRFKRTSF